MKQKDKPGKVIRVDPTTWKYITQQKQEKETLSAVVRRLLGLAPKKGNWIPNKFFILPSSLFNSVSEARGAAVMQAVKKKDKSIERPIEVRKFEN